MTKRFKFEQWIKKDLLGAINVTHSENGESVFHQAVKKKNLPLITKKHGAKGIR